MASSLWIAEAMVSYARRGLPTPYLLLDWLIGKTKHLRSETPSEEDLSVETLTSDLVNMLRVVYPDTQTAPSLLVRLLAALYHRDN